MCSTHETRFSLPKVSRSDTAGLHRKVAKNQTKAIRIILTGTHEQMMKIAQEGKLGNWIDANLKWLRETFGSENLVSCVLHMDEKTPHLHATVVGCGIAVLVFVQLAPPHHVISRKSRSGFRLVLLFALTLLAETFGSNDRHDGSVQVRSLLIPGRH